MLPLSGCDPIGEFGRRAADQHGDGVLVLRALHADIDLLRLGGLDLGSGGRDVAGGDGIAGFELVLHDFERLLVLLRPFGRADRAANRRRGG